MVEGRGLESLNMKNMVSKHSTASKGKYIHSIQSTALFPMVEDHSADPVPSQSLSSSYSA